MKSRLKRNIPLHLMLVPAVICVLVYNYIPLAGILISFKDKSPWVGLDNFRYMLELPSFYQVVWNTFLISIMKIIADLIGAITIALMLNEVRKAFWRPRSQVLGQIE